MNFLACAWPDVMVTLHGDLRGNKYGIFFQHLLITLFVLAYPWNSFEVRPSQDLSGPLQAADMSDKQPAPTTLTAGETQKSCEHEHKHSGVIIYPGVYPVLRLACPFFQSALQTPPSPPDLLKIFQELFGVLKLFCLHEGLQCSDVALTRLLQRGDR